MLKVETVHYVDCKDWEAFVQESFKREYNFLEVQGDTNKGEYEFLANSLNWSDFHTDVCYKLLNNLPLSVGDNKYIFDIMCERETMLPGTYRVRV